MVEMPIQRRTAAQAAPIQPWQQAVPYYFPVFRNGDAVYLANRGKKIYAANRFVAGASRVRLARPAHHPRHANAAFIDGALLVSERPGRAVRMLGRDRR